MSSLIFGNGSDIVHWQPSPKSRGTFDILSTCIVTLLLCVWTAVHLNISPPGSFWRPKLRKIGWSILALLAPEMVAYTAWFQRQQALYIMREVNKAYGIPKPLAWHKRLSKAIKKAAIKLNMKPKPQETETTRHPTLEAQRDSFGEDRHPWTIVHGFYAVMGGIATEVSESLPKPKRFLPSDANETWFVTVKGIEHIIEHCDDWRDILPNLSEEDIESKSKANGIAKAIVCIQALWFIAQCFSRFGQRLPISLLELNTFGHAICALLIYVLWWHKPFEVDIPTMVKSKHLENLCAAVWMVTELSPATKKFRAEYNERVQLDKAFRALSWWRKRRFQKSYPQVEKDFVFGTRLEGVPEIGNSDQDHVGHDGNTEEGSELDEHEDDGSISLVPGQTLPGTAFQLWNPNESKFKLTSRQSQFQRFYRDKIISTPLPNLNLTYRDVTRWRRSWSTVQRLYDKMGEFQTGIYLRALLIRRPRNWPEYASLVDENLVKLGFSAAAMIYGGLHVLAWNAHFSSATEQLLWRISAALVTGGLLVIFVSISGVDWREIHIALPDVAFVDIDEILIKMIIRPLIPLIVLAYILARAYLVVECFINLSHLPAGAYDVPAWSAYFPHIS